MMMLMFATIDLRNNLLSEAVIKKLIADAKDIIGLTGQLWHKRRKYYINLN